MHINPLSYTAIYANCPAKKYTNAISFGATDAQIEHDMRIQRLFDAIKNKPNEVYEIIKNGQDEGEYYTADLYHYENDEYIMTYLIKLIHEEQEKKGHIWSRNKASEAKIDAWKSLARLFGKQNDFNPNLRLRNGKYLIDVALKYDNYTVASIVARHPNYKEPEHLKSFRQKTDNLFDASSANMLTYLFVTAGLDTLSKSKKKTKTNSSSNNIPKKLESYYVKPGEFSPTSLDDVAGMSEAKKAINEYIVKPWSPKYRQVIKDNHIEMPNGFMMYGPPGCGKTFIVQAIAAEMGLPMFQIKMGTIGSSSGHETEKEIANVFEILQNKYESTKEPSILFLDEIDTICGSRKDMKTDWRRDEVNAVLQEINNAAQKGIILIGATNFIEALDEAVLRTGRFDKKIEIRKPNTDERREILVKMSKKGPIARNAMKFIDELTDMTDGCSCSDINAMFNKALLSAVFNDKHKVKSISLEDCKKALEEIKFSNNPNHKVVAGFSQQL